MTACEAVQLRVYVNTSDRWQGKPLYEAVVSAAHAAGLAGASVFPVNFSFGAHRRIHDDASDYQFVEEPVVIEVVDTSEKIDSLLATIGPMLNGGLVTVQNVRVLRREEAPRAD